MPESTPEQLFEQSMEQLSIMGARLQAPPHVTLTTAVELIEAAITHGAQLYNAGAHARCYHLYVFAATQLLRASRYAPPGPKTQAALLDLERALMRAELAPSDSAAAWAMRHAFDKIQHTRQLTMKTLHTMLALGEAAFRRADYGGSADAFADAAQVAPDLWDLEMPEDESVQAAHLVYLYYSHTLLLDGRALEAADAMRQGITRIPQMGSLNFDLRALGSHYAAFEARQEWLEELAPTHPAHAVAPLLIAYIMIFSGQRRRAADKLRVYLAQHPDDAAAQILLAMTPQILMD